MLLQNVEFAGPLGLLVAAAIVIGVIVAAIKGIQWLWQTFGVPLRERIYRVRVGRAEKEFLEFWQGFFDHRKQLLIMILNEKKECIYISTGLANAWQTSFSMVQGRRWHRFHKASTLSSYLDRLDESYELQSPFIYLTTIEPNGHEEQFLVRAEPCVLKQKVKYFVISMERMQESNVRQIESHAREQ